MSNEATAKVLADVSAMQAKLAALEAQNAALTAKLAQSHRVSYKVSEKGALSVYGMGRFPITHYKSTWTALLARAEEIKAFMKANDAALKNKGE